VLGSALAGAADSPSLLLVFVVERSRFFVMVKSQNEMEMNGTRKLEENLAGNEMA
jgi:hypothetical protein